MQDVSDIYSICNNREDAYSRTGSLFIRDTARDTAYSLWFNKVWPYASLNHNEYAISRAVSRMKMPPVREYASSLISYTYAYIAMLLPILIYFHFKSWFSLKIPPRILLMFSNKATTQPLYRFSSFFSFKVSAKSKLTMQWRSRGLPRWTTRPPGEPKWGQKWGKFKEK